MTLDDLEFYIVRFVSSTSIHSIIDHLAPLSFIVNADVLIRRWKISLSSGSSGIHMEDMGAVCCMVVVDDTFHYPLLHSNPVSDLSEMI